MRNQELSLTPSAVALLGCGADESTPTEGGGVPMNTGPDDAGPGVNIP